MARGAAYVLLRYACRGRPIVCAVWDIRVELIEAVAAGSSGRVTGEMTCFRVPRGSGVRRHLRRPVAPQMRDGVR